QVVRRESLCRFVAVLGAMERQLLCREARVGDALRRGYRGHGILRTFALYEIEVRSISIVVEFFRLPHAQPFHEVAVPEVIFGRCDLFGKPGWVAGEVERLGGNYARGLMVLMVLADDRSGQHRDHNFRPCQPYEAHSLAERAAVVRRLE